MKRILSLLLALMLIVGLIPFSAMAVEEESYTYINPLYADVITEEDLVYGPPRVNAQTTGDDVNYASTFEGAGAQLRKAMVAREQTIVVLYQTKSYDIAQHKDIFNAAVAHTGNPKEGDALLWNYAGYRVSVSRQIKNGVTYATFTYTMTYYTTAEQEAELDAAVDALLAKLNPTGTAYEKLSTVYDWICENVVYDYDHYYTDPDYKLQYTAYAAMIHKTSVCQGYATLLYRLALEMGIDCRVITGIGAGGGHGWNIVKLGKYYYNLDPTWDAIWYQGLGYYNYYLQCEKNFTSNGTDHYRDAEYDTAGFHALYPISPVDFDPRNDNSGSVEPPKPELAAPYAESGTKASTGKPVITWNQVDGAEKYEVYRANSLNGTYSRKITTTKTTYTNTAAVGGKTYYYYVRAIASDGRSVDSNIVSCTCILSKTAATVANDTASGKTMISWEAVEGATAYEVYRASSKNGNYSALMTVDQTQTTDSTAVAGKTYYYKVRAVCSVPEAAAPFSEVKSRTCDLPQTKVSVSNKASTGKIVISWEAVEGATKYEVYRATSKNGEYSRITTTSKTQVTNTSTKAGKTYYYKVRAICGVDAAKAAFSDVKSRTCDLPQPEVSIGLSSGKPKVSWEKVDGAVSYKIYRATSKSGTYSLVKTSTGSYYKDTKAVSGKTYYYKVVAAASAKAANSAYSGVVSIKSK